MSFGVNFQNFMASIYNAAKPDVLSLIKYIGADTVLCSPEQAGQSFIQALTDNGIKVVFGLCTQPSNPTALPIEWQSADALINHLNSFPLDEWNQNVNITGLILAGEPCGRGDYYPDNLNPQPEVLSLVETARAGYEHLKSRTNKLIFHELNPAGAAYDDFVQLREFPDQWQDILVRRRAWVDLWLPLSDVLAYNLYDLGSSWTGTQINWFDYEPDFREAFRQMLQMLKGAAGSKQVFLTETGCPSAPAYGQSFTEELQRRYIEIVFEVCESYSVKPFIFKLLDVGDSFGIFHSYLENNMSAPKIAAMHLNQTYGGTTPQKFYTLTITINAPERGETFPNSPQVVAEENSVIPIEAIPYEGFKFDYWDYSTLGNRFSTENPIYVTFDQDKTLTAYFSEIPEEHKPTIAARTIGPYGVPSALLYQLWKLRERYIRPEVHKKLHPLV